MVEIIHSTYTSSPGMENERTHHSFIRSDSEMGNILSVYDFIEEKIKKDYPKELIKFYRSDSNNNCDAFLNKYLWAANPLSFNDPFDCSIQLWEEESFTKENLMKIINPQGQHLIKDDEQYNLQLFQDIKIATLGIICLHEFKDSSQDILWGYYTNQEGFSIKFDTNQLIRQWGNPFRVDYAPDLNIFSLNDINSTEDLFPRFLRWTTQKKRLWSEENEWRFIFSNLKADTFKMDASDIERKKEYPLNALNEVVLGLRFFNNENSVAIGNDSFYFITDSIKHHKQNQILTHLSDHQNIPTFHMFFLRNKFEMLPRKCRIYKINDNRFLINYPE